MAYRVKELFATLQGEGARTGRAAVFCRFTGCNLWTGHERHRAAAVCRFCDTDFVGTDGPGGGVFTDAHALAEAAGRVWVEGIGPAGHDVDRYLVCTGGEPLLQLDPALLAAFHTQGFEVAIETNGTLPVPAGVDWVCVSPKAGAELVTRAGDELKVVGPQPDLDLDELAGLDFRHRFVQPMAPPGAGLDVSTAWAVDYCRHHPAWRLSLQTHKLLGIP